MPWLLVVSAGLSRRVTSFALTNECSWQEDQSLPPHQQDNATACRHDFRAMLHDAQQVYAAAERLVRQSCHEDWLLQPYIPDIQEYRYDHVLATDLVLICPEHSETRLHYSGCGSLRLCILAQI